MLKRSWSVRQRKRLVYALVAAPLIVALPALWTHLGEPGFVRHNLDILVIYFVLPYAAALWLGFAMPKPPRR